MKPRRTGKKSDATRQRVLDAALALFRKRGFDRTTMRDVARAAGLSLGAAYYYFPSKESIVLAYYAAHQQAHTARAREAYATTTELRARLGAAFHTKFDLIRPERKLLGALFRFVGDPAHPLSVFGKKTRAIREQAIAVFEEALADTPLPDDLAALLPTALWALLLGMLLYFIQDGSPGQARTHRLIDRTLDLATPLIAVAASPALALVRGKVLDLLDEANLLERIAGAGRNRSG